MTAIQDALSGTAIVRAKIWNPWDQACEQGADLAELQGAPELTAAPQTIPEDEDFAQIRLVKKSAYLGRLRQLAKNSDLELTSGTFDTAKLLMKTEYLQWGRANYRGVTGGNCTYLAGVVVGFLSENMGLVPPGATVEQFNLFEKGQGHAFVVIGRDPASSPATPSTWGDACFIIDQWYARQRITRPGRNAVKDVTGTAPDFLDKDFLGFIGTGTIARGVTFSHEQMTGLR